MAGGKGLDGASRPAGDPTGVLGRLHAVQLHGLQSDLVGDLDDPLRRLVPEDAHGDRLVWKPLDDVGHGGRGHLPRGRGEHEPDGGCSHPHRQESIGFAGHTADLDEESLPVVIHSAVGHGRAPSRPATAARRSPARTSASPTNTAWYPAAASAATSSASLMPDSATATTPVGDGGGQCHGATSVDFERVEVPLVDADHRGSGGQGTDQLVLVVHLDQGGEGEGVGQLYERCQLVVVERCGDEQYGVGAHRPGVAHVEGADGEVLAQHRQGAGGPGRPQIIGSAAEEGLIGEHRQTGRTSGLVVGRHLSGIQCEVEIAAGGRAPLDLGDHRHAVTLMGGTEAPMQTNGPVRPQPPRRGRPPRSRWSAAASCRCAATMVSR